ncbi:MAG: hypothetical protein AAB416_03625 [Patescibacteria group bacterium]
MNLLSSRLQDAYTSVFFRNRLFVITTVLTLLFHSALWVLVFLNREVLVQEGKDFITLHYRVFSGTDLVAPWYGIFGILAFAFAVAVGNLAYARNAILTNPALGLILSSGAAVIQLTVIAATYLIIQVNTF